MRCKWLAELSGCRSGEAFHIPHRAASLKLREEFPDLAFGPGLVAAARAVGGAVNRSGAVTATVERAPFNRIRILAAGELGAHVRVAGGLGRRLRGAAI